jgi:hypothetical protein
MQHTTGIVVNHLSFLGAKAKQLGVLNGRKSEVSVMQFNVILRRFRATIVAVENQ